jgi:hypothetical protein
MQSNFQLTVDLDVGVWGKVPLHTVWSACWLPNGQMLTGGETGELVTWRAFAARSKVPAHGVGTAMHRPDGKLGHNGVRVIKLRSDHRCART